MRHSLMRRPDWIVRAIRILRHDITLLTLVAVFVAVSAGVITAAIPEASLQGEVALGAPGASPGGEPAGPFEEELARAQVPVHLEALAFPDRLEVTLGELRRGDSLVHALKRHGVSAALVNVVTRELRPLFDFRRARPGQRFRVAHTLDGSLVEFRFLISDLESYVVRRDGPGYLAAREEVALESDVVRIAGVISTSLHEAIVQLGERGQLANDFSEIFAWDIDFSRAVRSGDEFRILYERLYRRDANGERSYVRPGRILAATYQGRTGEFDAVYFEPEKGRGGYYRPDGSSVEGQFLRAPLRFSRITSVFTSARRHPILKVTRPHQGVDYAAPTGTPLWSVADGRVIYRGWGGGFGNMIKIRHNNGYVSYYPHLSRFAKGLQVGQHVQQKQVIGYVGSTGLATGPHVCFRIAKEGKYIDPMRVVSHAGPPVPEDMKNQFAATRDSLLGKLSPAPLVTSEQAL